MVDELWHLWVEAHVPSKCRSQAVVHRSDSEGGPGKNSTQKGGGKGKGRARQLAINAIKVDAEMVLGEP
jgi:hypothetical protein